MVSSDDFRVGDTVAPLSKKGWSYGKVIKVNPRTVLIRVEHPVGGLIKEKKVRLRKIG